MSLSDWIGSVVLCAAICSGALYFLSGNPSVKCVRLLCGLIMCAVTALPLTNIVKNFREISSQGFIFSDYGNTLDTEEHVLSQQLILQTAEQRLSVWLQEELERRLSRKDFTVRVYADGRASLVCSEDFPREQARWIVSALLGGCEVEITEGMKENE